MTAATKNSAAQVPFRSAYEMPSDAQQVTEPAPARPRTRRVPKKYLPTRASLTRKLGPDVMAYLDSLRETQLICLAYGHKWPVLMIGRGRPAGWHSFWAGAGVFQIIEDCVRDDTGGTCGSTRSTYTGENGIFMERGKHRRYKYDDSWKKRPEGSKLTRLDVIDYITYRMAGELFGDVELGEGALA